MDSNLPGNFGIELQEDLTLEDIIDQLEEHWIDAAPTQKRKVYIGRHCVTYGFIMEKGFGFRVCNNPLCLSCNMTKKLLDQEIANL